MDELPKSVSVETIRRAGRLAKNALGIDLNPGTVRWIEGKDLLFFMLTNGPDLSIIFCSPSCYFVELHRETEDGELFEEFLMIKNIRNWLFYLRRNNYHDCEHMIEFEEED